MHGVKVICVDTDARAPGFRTRYGKARLCPNPDIEPNAWLSFMQETGRQLGGRPVVIPSADQFVSAIARFAPQLHDFFIFCEAGIGAQSLLATKERQYAIAEQNGLHTPRSHLIHTRADLQAFIDDAVFPCLIKPLHCRDWERLPANHPLLDTKLAVANTSTDLLQRYDSVQNFTPSVVAQEVIDGPDTAKVVFLSCYANDGRRLAACLVREIRTSPIGFGSASVVEPFDDEVILGQCERFLQSLNYAGLCEIELKTDCRDGKTKLIEANPRYSVTADAARCVNLDLGWLHYLDLIGINVEEEFPARSCKKHIALRRDFRTAASYVQAGLASWGDIISSYCPPVAFYDLDWRDWRVALGTIRDLIHIVARPTWRRLFPRKSKTADVPA
jgi:predicted ATP-grasp superfamily ATP-dependent carboligase